MRFKDIFKNVKSIDWFIFLIFPAIISGVYLWSLFFYSDPALNPLFLNLAHPQWWQFITINFVHFTFNHFLVNLFVYFLFGIIILLIFKDCNVRKRDYILLFIFLLIILPIISGIVSILIYKKGIAGGSSGITSAMFMFLVVVVYFHNLKNSKKQNGKTTLIKLISWAFFFGVGIYCLFPKNTEGVSIFGHLIGIIFGIVLAIIFLKKYDIQKWGFK